MRYQELFEAGAELIGSYRCALPIAAPKLTLAAGGLRAGRRPRLRRPGSGGRSNELGYTLMS